MNIDFNLLKKSIGKELKFQTEYTVDEIHYVDKFYAVLKQVENDFIVVEQHLLYMNENADNNFGTFNRKLLKGDFTIDTMRTALNG